VEQILNMIKNEAYSLVYIPDPTGQKAAAFTGFRLQHTLRTGPMIYVDDLYTNPSYRGKGYAGALLDYIDEVAAAQLVPSVHLDSGFALHDAHRLYLNKGYILSCHHFSKLPPEFRSLILAPAK
jgi:GNAT superfamily N-acetyltransferase